MSDLQLAEAAEVNGACHLFSITRASARTWHTHVELELPPHYFGSGGYSLPIERTILRPSRVMMMTDFLTAKIRSHRRNIQRYSLSRPASRNLNANTFISGSRMSRLTWNARRCNHLSLNTQPEHRLSKTIVEQQAQPDLQTCLAPNPPRSATQKLPRRDGNLCSHPNNMAAICKAFRG